MAKNSRAASRKANRKGSRSASRKGSRKGSRSASRKASRKANRKASRKANRRCWSGGYQAPVNYSNPGPMELNLAQGKQFAGYHAAQHGGALAYGPYPGAVEMPSELPADLVASAKLLPLNQAFDYIRQFGPEADLKGGRRRGSRKTRKGRKGSRKQRGGDFLNGSRNLGFMNALRNKQAANAQATQKRMEQRKKCHIDYQETRAAVPTMTAERYVAAHPDCARFVTESTPLIEEYLQNAGARRKGRKGRKASRKGSRKGRSASRKQRGGDFVRWGGARKGMKGGSYAEMRFPMPVADEGKMLIPAGLQMQAGLNPEWKLAENPLSFAPNM